MRYVLLFNQEFLRDQHYYVLLKKAYYRFLWFDMFIIVLRIIFAYLPIRLLIRISMNFLIYQTNLLFNWKFVICFVVFGVISLTQMLKHIKILDSIEEISFIIR